MTTQEREARLTAYALNDPSLGESDRQEVEAALRSDPAARQAVEETLRLAQLLTSGLAAEQAAIPLEKVVAIPSAHKRRWSNNGWRIYASIAAMLFVAVGGYIAFDQMSRRAERTFAHTGATTSGSGPATEMSIGDPSVDLSKDTTGKTDRAITPASSSPALEGVTAREVLPRGDVGRDASGSRSTADAIRRADSSPAGRPGSGYAGPKGPGFGAGTGIPGPGLPGGSGIPGGLPSPASPTPTGPVASIPGGPPPGTPPVATGDNYERPDGRGWLETDRREGTSPNDRHGALIENSFITVAGEAALSTFGVDVDTASYAIVRKYLSMGQMPPANAIRLEELVNYFRYQDKAPDGDDPFAVTVELAECPWQPKHRLARIGLKAKPIDNDKRPPSNLVFLIDVSGSMAGPNRLPLVKQSLRMLVNQLGENDRVAMVVYAGASGLVLDSSSAMQKETILGALDRLNAGGSTNGAGGMQQAYDVAKANFIKNGTNRVILCTDGDWNVGTTSTEALVQMVEEKRKTGVFLSVFGFGMGNLRDEMLVKLAGKGNGNYGYIDSLKEANKALVEQLGGTLVTVAKDVKIQVEFNPATVQSYRLLGYEKRALAAKDFADDTKDAGEMGAGHVVTALYELVPAGLPAPAGEKKGEGLRYQQADAAVKPAVRAGAAKEAFVVKMRHKKPDSDTSTLRELPVTDLGKSYGDASEDFRFSAAVASFSMLLRNSPHKGEASFALIHELADSARKHDPSGYRAEFMEMIKQAKKITGKP